MQIVFKRLAAVAVGLTLFCRPAQATDMFVFFGTHVQGAGKGFSLSHFDTDTGILTPPKFLLEAPAPGFFVLSRDHTRLYANNSINTYQGKLTGTLSAYSINPTSAHLTLLNTVEAGGADPSYISLDNTNKFVFTANYQSGTIAAFALKPDGSIGDRTAFFQHIGKGIDPIRQTHAYAHSIKVDPTNRFVLSADLGLDRLFVYRFDATTGGMTPNDPSYVSVTPGVGARHFTFAPNGKIVYLVSEMGSRIFEFAWDSEKGVLTQLQEISSLPDDFKGTSACAEIEVHPSGKFLYTSNRGMDSISVFAIDAVDGHLTPLQHITTEGKTPRNFAFDPTGKWLLVTNHGSNNAMVFKIDQETGQLTPNGSPVAVPYPFCERFLAVPSGTTQP
ncbi:MAG: lactonase family protein [Planctomycetota bacterium]|nr:lactonase family protein [Planctomycetota bacterium]